MLEFFSEIDAFVWGPPLLVLLVGTGIWLTIRLNLIQVLRLPLALKLIFKAKNEGHGDVDSFKALCTALAATVGTGNIVGVATAIKAGGPGALFWMWMAAFFGMATKYAEGVLAVKYRTIDANGNIGGGPMYYIEKGLGKSYRPLAIFFAVAGTICACFGSGTFAQVNSIVEITNIGAGIPIIYTAAILTVLVAVITLGGLQSIAKVADKIVPFMAVLYVATTAAILFAFRDALPDAVAMVLHDAFTGTAATGGFLGATMMYAMRNGIARGLFSNESGLGSAPIVAAAAKTKWPAEQGLISMTGTFIDTIIICTMTGLTIIVSGVWSGDLNGAAMTQSAFTMVFPVFGNLLLMIGLVLFAGVKAIIPYRLFFIAMVGCGAFLKLEVIWVIADIANGLMALPNLIALLLLTGVIVKETQLYFKHLDENKDYLK